MTVEDPQQESLLGDAYGFSKGLDGIGDKLQRRDQRDEVETLMLERERLFFLHCKMEPPWASLPSPSM